MSQNLNWGDLASLVSVALLCAGILTRINAALSAVSRRLDELSARVRRIERCLADDEGDHGSH